MTDYALATVKALGDEDSFPGEFEAILSTSALDRDGEIIDAKAFDPLPESIPIYFEHDWKSGAKPVGRGVPFYDGDVVKVKGVYASTATAQEIRSLVTEGIVDSMSVGFLNGKRTVKAGNRHVTSGEVFEGSLTAIPINTTAKMIAAKSLGLADPTDARQTPTVKAVAGTWEQRSESLYEALSGLYANADWIERIATFDDNVVYEVHSMYAEDETFRCAYTFDGTEVTLDVPEAVDAATSLTVTPKSLARPDLDPLAAEATGSTSDATQASARIRLLAAG